jgi:hypothetical protein
MLRPRRRRRLVIACFNCGRIAQIPAKAAPSIYGGFGRCTSRASRRAFAQTTAWPRLKRQRPSLRPVGGNGWRGRSCRRRRDPPRTARRHCLHWCRDCRGDNPANYRVGISVLGIAPWTAGFRQQLARITSGERRKPKLVLALFQVRFKVPLHVASEHQSATTAS